MPRNHASNQYPSIAVARRMRRAPPLHIQRLRSVSFAVLLTCAGSLAHADEGLAGFGRITPAEEGASTDEKPAADPFGPVPTDKISIVNVAPVLLPYFNNAPVFGTPGTVTGDIWNRTQLTGDWGGERTALARKGFFFDMYNTSTYQNVINGGLKAGETFVNNNQLSMNIDTGRAGWWSGGVLHVTVQSRYGRSAADTFTGGGNVPQYTGLVLPGPTNSDNTYFSEYYVAQALSKHVSVVAGKISDIFIPDQTMMGNSYKYYFANFNFNKNPMTTNFYNPSALAVLGIWAPSRHFALAGGVLDPYSEPNNLAHDAFKKVNLYLMTLSSYSIGGLPGQFGPAFNWSNKPKTDLSNPFRGLTVRQIPEAVGALVGGSSEGLTTNTRNESWFAIANLSQYLYVKDSPSEIPNKLRSGQVLRGVGVFGRVGYAPQDTNTVTRDASVALFAHGIFDSRPYDSFGVGYYYNSFSGELKNSISRLTAGTEKVKDERGMEVFYNFAITPAVRLIPSYQHIWNPLSAQVATKQDSTNIFMTRLTVAF